LAAARLATRSIVANRSPGVVDRPVPMAGESGLEYQTCQAVTGFARDFRDDAARRPQFGVTESLQVHARVELG